MPKTIIFDFDGTLVDSFCLIIKIYNKLAPRFNCREIHEEDLPKLRGRKPQDFLKDYGVTKLKLTRILGVGRKEFAKGIVDLELIPGILDFLENLKAKNYRLGIMTSNSEENVRIFLERNKMTDIFDFIYSEKNLFGKAKVLKKLLKKQNILLENAVYVGDETRDIEAAQKIEMKIISVSWGLNNKEILENLNPNFVAKNPTELFELIKRI